MNFNYFTAMNFTAVIAAAAGLVTGGAVFRSFRRCSVKRRWALFAGLGALSIPFLLFVVYYLHILPEWAWFYEFRSWRGSEFSVIPLGGAAGAAISLLPRRLAFISVLILLMLAIVPGLKPILQPLDQGMLKDRWKGRACLQSTPSTCGPASACTILKYLGGSPSEPAAARGSFSNAGGTEAWYLARWIRRQGFRVRFEISRDHSFSPAGPLPAMIGVREGNWGHFIAVLTADPDGMVTFADPLRGEEILPVAEFQRKYEFTGFRMAVSKP